MVVDDGAIVLLAGQAKTIVFSGTFAGNRVALLYGPPNSPYSVVEWVAALGALGTPLHLHRTTDEAFYVLEGTFGFEVGQRTLEEVSAGAFIFVPKGVEHAFWNGGHDASKVAFNCLPCRFRAVL